MNQATPVKLYNMQPQIKLNKNTNTVKIPMGPTLSHFLNSDP